MPQAPPAHATHGRGLHAALALSISQGPASGWLSPRAPDSSVLALARGQAAPFAHSVSCSLLLCCDGHLAPVGALLPGALPGPGPLVSASLHLGVGPESFVSPEARL